MLVFTSGEDSYYSPCHTLVGKNGNVRLNFQIKLESYFTKFQQFGGFPEVVLAQNKDEKLDLLQDIYSSYMNMDILQVSDIQKPNELMHIIQLLSSRIGSKIDISKIANTVKISRQTVENYLNVLESTFLIHFLPVYSQNPDKEIVKAKKVYFSDNGIANINGDLSGGQKFENAVFNQLKHFGDLAYYQLKTGNEIDFILNKEIAFEVKELAYHNDLNSLKRLSKNIDIKENKVVSRFQGEVFDELIWGGMIK
jgi:predicted AAA+ superfamily ATPase